MLDFKDEDKYVYGPYLVAGGTSPVLTMGDPLRIYRTLLLHCRGDINQVISDSHATIPAQYSPEGTKLSDEQPDLLKRYQSTDLLISATRAAFNMVPFDPQTGTGATDALCLSVFDTFMEWLESFDSPVASGPASSTTTGSLRGVLPLTTGLSSN